MVSFRLGRSLDRTSLLFSPLINQAWKNLKDCNVGWICFVYFKHHALSSHGGTVNYALQDSSNFDYVHEIVQWKCTWKLFPAALFVSRYLPTWDWKRKIEWTLTCLRSIDRSIDQSINQSINQPVSQLQPVNQSITQSINQSINQSVSVSQSIN